MTWGSLSKILMRSLGYVSMIRSDQTMKEDKTLTCCECNQEFVFTASEQEFYAEKGFTNEPRRCPACRQARKQRMGIQQPERPQREMFPATCAECGKETMVPFKPSNDRPVYCRDCFNARKSH